MKRNSKIVKLTERQMKSMFGIKMLSNSYKAYIERYMPLSKLIEFLENNTLTFVRPNCWNDPFETLYYNADYSNIKSFIKPKNVYCVCVRNSNENEEASWKI